MNIKQKIVLTITSISLFLLLILSMTYAYYVTRIVGNTNDVSIEITTADLRLVYGDGNKAITVSWLMPGDDIPAKTFTVTNLGNAKVNDYVVVIEDVINTLTRPQDLRYTLTCVQKNGDGVVTGTCDGSSGQFPKTNSMIVTNSIDLRYVHEYTLKVEYVNLTTINQSDDMGSRIKGKVQIYGMADTIDLTGNVTNAEDGDYVQINSKKKTSQILNGEYKLVGIEPGLHSLKIMNSKGEKKTEKYILVGKDTTENITEGQVTLDNNDKVSVKNITFTKLSGVVTIDIDATTGELTVGDKIIDTNKYVEGTLAYKILDNAMLAKNENSITKTQYSPNPLSTPGNYISGTSERTLSVISDTYDDSYYFRGNVNDNYLELNDICWRIVRVEGDGSVKLVLAANKKCNEITSSDTESAFINTGDYGYTNDNLADYENSENRNSSMKYKFNEWFDTNLANVHNIIKSEKICLGNNLIKYDTNGVITTSTTNWYYENYKRLYIDKKVSLLCSAFSNQKYKIYPLTADEVVLAGNKVFENNTSYYLRENANNNWWTLTLVGHKFITGDGVYVFPFYIQDSVMYNSTISVDNSDLYLRPSISLIPAIELANDSGDGTKNLLIK